MSGTSGSKFLGKPSQERVISTVVEVASDAASAGAGAGAVIVAQKLNGYFGMLPATEVPATLSQNVTWICEGLPLLQNSALEGALPGIGITAVTTLFVYMTILALKHCCSARASYQIIGDGGMAGEDEPGDNKGFCGVPSKETMKNTGWYVGKNSIFAAAGAGTVLTAQAISGAFRTKPAIEMANDWVCNGIDLLRITLAIGLASATGGAAALALLLTVSIAAWNARSKDAVRRPEPDTNEELPGTPRDKGRCCC